MAEIGSSQRAQLPGALLAVTAEQHPQVLHRRAHAGVVQVDKVRAGQAAGRRLQRRPQDIARVTVTVQAQAAQGVRGLLVIRLLVACQRF